MALEVVDLKCMSERTIIMTSERKAAESELSERTKDVL